MMPDWGKVKSKNMSWPLLDALGKLSHFRLAAFGRSSSERVNSQLTHTNIIM